MAVRYSYLAIDSDTQLICDWFASLEVELTVNDRLDRTVYYFRTLANDPLPHAEKIRQDQTPLVFVTKPQRIRGTLWTDGEVLFTPTPLKPQFPELHRISQSFAKWIKQFDMVFSQKPGGPSNWNYYLEAGIQNFDTALYALPRAMQALQSGQYFVHHRASAFQLDTLVKSLRLRDYAVDDA